jgi:Ser/Thr protein kinase RdoA (MazF antagonist)
MTIGRVVCRFPDLSVPTQPVDSMAVDGKIERILRLYPDDCHPLAIEPLVPADSFSGARLWRIQSERGTLCLRRWPRQHPDQQRLEFIQAVLWHVDQEGFHRVPLPLETRHHHGYVWHESHLWELTPWLPGAAAYRRLPTAAKLVAALEALAQFHQAASSFPLPETGPTVSPGLTERRDQMRRLLDGGLGTLGAAVNSHRGAELGRRAERLLSTFARVAPRILPSLERAAEVRVALQPCIRDVWHAHVLFEGERVSGIVDFGAMRPENVAADVARLLGSLAGDDVSDWQRGLAAYQAVRRLTDNEQTLLAIFDRSSVLLGGLQWLQWIYVECREFHDPAAVQSRLDEFIARMDTLEQSLGKGIDRSSDA